MTWLLNDILMAMVPVIEALDARGRFKAMKAMPSGTSEHPWLIPAMVIGLVAVAAAIAGIIVYHKRAAKRRRHADFSHRASRAGLDPDETELLWAVAQTGRSDMPSMIINNGRLFEESARRFSSSRKFRQVPAAQQNQMRVLISAVRGKLGFQLHAAQAAQRQQALRSLELGAVILAAQRGRNVAFEAVIREIGPSFLVVDVPRAKVECRQGDGWLLRFSHGGIVWEFEAAVMASNGSQVVLSMMGDSIGQDEQGATGSTAQAGQASSAAKE